jgi:hypothetical protein
MSSENFNKNCHSECMLCYFKDYILQYGLLQNDWLVQVGRHQLREHQSVNSPSSDQETIWLTSRSPCLSLILFTVLTKSHIAVGSIISWTSTTQREWNPSLLPIVYVSSLQAQYAASNTNSQPDKALTKQTNIMYYE